MEIAVWVATPASGPEQTTPWGNVSVETIQIADRALGVFGREGDPRARAYAAKALGVQRVIGVFEGVALNRLLRDGDGLVADDVLDQTRGGPTTFFVERGLGYVQMAPPFCAETRTALVAALSSRNDQRRVFEVGTAVACPPRSITPAEAKAWRALGGDVAVWGLAPEWSLARELELCYAALMTIGAPLDLRPLLAAIVAALPVERHCSCAQLNSGARRELGADWRRWFGPSKAG